MSIANNRVSQSRKPKITPLHGGRLRVERWFKIQHEADTLSDKLTESIFGGFGLLDGTIDGSFDKEERPNAAFADCRLIDEKVEEFFTKDGKRWHQLYQIYETLTDAWVNEVADNPSTPVAGLRTVARVLVAKPGTEPAYDEDDVGSATIDSNGKTLTLGVVNDDSNERRGRIVTQWFKPGVLSIRPVRENGFNQAPSYYYTTVGLPASAIHAADGLTKPDGSTSLGADVTFFEPEVQNFEGFPTYTQYVIAADLGEEDDVLLHERDDMVRITDPGVMITSGYFSTGAKAGSCGRFPEAASQPRTYRKKAKLQVYLSKLGTISESEVAYTEEGIDWCSISFYNYYYSEATEGASSSGSWRSFSGFLNRQTTYDPDGDVIIQGSDGTANAGVLGVYNSFAKSTGAGSTTYNTTGIYRVSLKDYMKGPDGVEQYYLKTIITFP